MLEVAENTYSIRADVLELREQYLRRDFGNGGFQPSKFIRVDDANFMTSAQDGFYVAQADVANSTAKLESIDTLYRLLPAYLNSARDKDLLEKMRLFLVEYKRRIDEKLESFEAMDVDTPDKVPLARQEVEELLREVSWYFVGNPYRDNGFTREVASNILEQAKRESDNASAAYRTLSAWSYYFYILSFVCALCSAIGGAHDALPKPG